MDLRELDGSTIALVFIGDVDGNPDALHMNLASAQSDGVELILDFGVGPFDAQPDMLERLSPVPPDIRNSLQDAEWFIPFEVAPLPPGTDLAMLVVDRLRRSV
ncbi:MAG TPA: hypothetical protein VFK39_08655 [Gemmatimonadaceae bacterium]|nr:hypothetical protein [Gemmatimonadaceae bacterium]